MAHNIFNEKFLSVRQPAWHGLGQVVQGEISAVDAGRQIGVPAVYTRPIVTADGIAIPGYKAIIGQVGTGTPTPYSVVGNDYHAITHNDFLEAWDKATGGASIETIGLLGKGENLFVTTKLPTFDVRGDEVAAYLLAANILSGREADYGRITPVRVVCQNTLNLSARRFTEEFRVVHTGDAIRQIETWLRGVWETRQAQQQAIREAYNILAQFTLDTTGVLDVLEATYPCADRPNVDERTDAGLDALAAWQSANTRQIAHQQQVNHLFEGAGVGSDLKSAQGTGWGLWNAVVEYEDYGKARRSATSALFGAGADRKRVAFDSILSLAQS